MSWARGCHRDSGEVQGCRDARATADSPFGSTFGATIVGAGAADGPSRDRTDAASERWQAVRGYGCTRSLRPSGGGWAPAWSGASNSVGGFATVTGPDRRRASG